MGRIPSVESASVTKYGLGYIRPRHREIARRLISGQTQAEICDGIGMTEYRMSIIVNSPLFKIMLKQLEDERDANAVDIGRDLREISPVALDVIERTMYKAKSEKLRFEAAESILDRAGHGAINRTTLDVKGSIDVHQGMTSEELKAMIMERVKRMDEEKELKDRMEEDAKAIVVKWDMSPPPQEAGVGVEAGVGIGADADVDVDVDELQKEMDGCSTVEQSSPLTGVESWLD